MAPSEDAVAEEALAAIRKLAKLGRGKRGVRALPFRFSLDELDSEGGEGWLAPLRRFYGSDPGASRRRKKRHLTRRRRRGGAPL